MDPRTALFTQLNLIKNAKRLRDLAEAEALEANKTSELNLPITSTSNLGASTPITQPIPAQEIIPEGTPTIDPSLISIDTSQSNPIITLPPTAFETSWAKKSSPKKHKHPKEKSEKSKERSHRGRKAVEIPTKMSNLPAQHSLKSSTKMLAKKTMRNVPEPEPKKKRTEKKKSPVPEPKKKRTKKGKTPEPIEISIQSRDRLSVELLSKLSGQSVPSPEHEDDPIRRIIDEGIKEHQAEIAKEKTLSKIIESFRSELEAGSKLEAGEITASPPLIDATSTALPGNPSASTSRPTTEMVQTDKTPPPTKGITTFGSQ